MAECHTCRYFKPFSTSEREVYYRDEGDGWCRRFPPRGEGPSQPTVLSAGWCGEHIMERADRIAARDRKAVARG